ncbi:MAG: hypothetical protein Q4C61_12910 [Lachnospiraceae bacterium]|nr:hypothetical protein [Lachnospiraceae bacterium]
MILGAIVSLIPEGSSGEVSASIASETIGALLENPSMLKALRSMDDKAFSGMLEASLLKLYKHNVQQRLEERGLLSQTDNH